MTITKPAVPDLLAGVGRRFAQQHVALQELLVPKTKLCLQLRGHNDETGTMGELRTWRGTRNQRDAL